MSIPDLELTARLVGLPLPELWGRYVAVGGNLTLTELAQRITGNVDWPPREELFLAVALNEAVSDESLPSLAPLDGFLRAGLRAGSDRAVGAGVADRSALLERARVARASARRICDASHRVRQHVVDTSPRRLAGHPIRPLSEGRRLQLRDARRLDALLQSEAQIVWRTDAAGLVRRDSPTWRAYTGQTREQWVGDGWLDAVHPTDRGHAEENWRACVTADMPISAHLRLWHHAAKDWQLTRVRGVPLHDQDGRTSGWVGTISVVDSDARRPARPLARASRSS